MEAIVSLYNNFETKAKKMDLTTFLKGGSNQLFGQTLNKALNTTLGKQATGFLNGYGVPTELMTTIASNVASKAIDKQVDKLDKLIGKQINFVMGGFGFGGGGSANSGFSYNGIPQKEKYKEFIALERARKNHFIVQISSALTPDFAKTFNLFVTDIDLNPMNISGEKQRVGGAFVDSPTGAEATEVRITTMDDKSGTIKKWFEQHCSAVVASDGTFGVPAKYAVTINVIHAVVDGDNVSNAFSNKGLYRAASYEVQLSRREQAMQEVTLTFSQIDSFRK